MGVLLTCMSVHYMCVLVPMKVMRGVRFPETGVIDYCELLCGFLESNPSSLEEQPLLLITVLSL